MAAKYDPPSAASDVFTFGLVLWELIYCQMVGLGLDPVMVVVRRVHNPNSSQPPFGPQAPSDGLPTMPSSADVPSPSLHSRGVSTSVSGSDSVKVAISREWCEFASSRSDGGSGSMGSGESASGTDASKYASASASMSSCETSMDAAQPPGTRSHPPGRNTYRSWPSVPAVSVLSVPRPAPLPVSTSRAPVAAETLPAPQAPHQMPMASSSQGADPWAGEEASQERSSGDTGAPSAEGGAARPAVDGEQWGKIVELVRHCWSLELEARPSAESLEARLRVSVDAIVGGNGAGHAAGGEACV